MFFHSQGARRRGENQTGGSPDGKEGIEVAETLRTHRRCVLSTVHEGSWNTIQLFNVNSV